MTAQVQANGVASLIVYPTLANNAPSVLATDGSGTITTTPSQPVAGVPQSNVPGSNFTINDLSPVVISAGSYSEPLVKSKLVAAALRVTYSGAPLNRQGTIIFLNPPDHESVNGLSYGQAAVLPGSVVKAIDDRRTTLVTTAVDEEECSYPKLDQGSDVYQSSRIFAYPYSDSCNGGSSVTGTGVMGFITSGAYPGANFLVEVIFHWEAIQSAPSGPILPITPTPSVPEDSVAVRSAWSSAIMNQVNNPDSTMRTLIREGIRQWHMDHRRGHARINNGDLRTRR